MAAVAAVTGASTSSSPLVPAAQPVGHGGLAGHCWPFGALPFLQVLDAAAVGDFAVGDLVPVADVGDLVLVADVGDLVLVADVGDFVAVGDATGADVATGDDPEEEYEQPSALGFASHGSGDEPTFEPAAS